MFKKNIKSVVVGLFLVLTFFVTGMSNVEAESLPTIEIENSYDLCHDTLDNDENTLFDMLFFSSHSICSLFPERNHSKYTPALP